MTTTCVSENYEQADWQNPRVFGINKLPPRFAAWPCPDAESGWKSCYDFSPWVKSLNGEWDFHWVAHPDQRPRNFYETGFDASGWKKIPVPTCWELEGLKIEPVGQPNYGVPIYSNYTYPHAPTTSGRVMDTPPEHFTSYKQRNPVGSYRTHFVVPRDWKGGRTIIHFAGVYSAMYVWVNGQKVGFSQDSRSPAEFDITDFLKEGENLLAVEVYRWGSGSYLEDQDMWRMSGIYRDVFVYHTPDVTLWDAYFHAELNAACDAANVHVQYTLRNMGKVAVRDVKVRVSLRDPVGNLVGGGVLIEDVPKAVDTGIHAEVATAEVPVEFPLLWTTETPNVYDALIELMVDGQVVETRRVDVGFRKVAIVDNQYCINNKAIKIRGVNRHESSPTGGYVLSRQLLERDLGLIKRNNINFTRCSHYPNDPRWYELCNRWGMMLVDEANVESHELSYHMKVLPGDDPAWEPATVDRMQRMVIRDRGNPCVTMWSLGNEAGYGKAFWASRKATHAADPQLRPIQYADMNMVADVDSQTYPTVDWLKLHLQGKAVRKGEHGEIGVTEQHGPYPSGRGFMTNEYAHAHQNSLGNLQDYWDMFHAHPQYWGGFIWEWADQTLLKRDENGQYFHAYGGDFGDQPNNGRFCIKGLVSADREERPHYWEAKKAHQYIQIAGIDVAAGKVRIQNLYHSLPLSEFSADWVLEENGIAIAQGTLADIHALPGQMQNVVIPWGSPNWQAGREYFITVRFRLKRDTPWAKTGHEVAWEQLAVVGQPAKQAVSLAKSPVPVLVQNGADWVASAGRVSIRVSGQTGLLTSMMIADREQLRVPMKPNFWRVPLDNDIGWHVPKNFGPWRTAADQAVLKSLEGVVTDAGAVIRVELQLPLPETSVVLTYQLRGDGVLRVHMLLNIGKDAPELSRIGLTFGVPASYEGVQWFGRGPHENYRDRKTSAAVGLYQAKVSEWITHYVRPVDNGNRTDVRWMELSDEAGAGLKVTAGMQLLSVSAWPYTAEDLDVTPHDYQLPRRDFITVNVDGFQMGVGGDTSWGEPVHHEYRIESKGPHEFAFEISAK